MPAATTEHVATDELIDGLRKTADALADQLATAADRLVELGEANEALLAENDALVGEVERTGLELMEAEAASRDLDEWRDSLEDFKRGVRDRDELLERTVGRE